jgi:hypothetical protein
VLLPRIVSIEHSLDVFLKARKSKNLRLADLHVVGDESFA